MTIEEYFEKQEEIQSEMELTMDDVWGKDGENDGMIIAKSNQNCPVFEDIVPYKSVTVLCELEQEKEVRYWLNYVLGGGCVSKVVQVIKGNDIKVALRADYQCW